MTRDLPSRIDPDAILEALIEIRFAAGDLPEIFMGALLSSPVFKGLTPTRLPQADIPMSARESDPALRYQPVYEMKGENELIRIGTSSISIHKLVPYCGWSAFRERTHEIVSAGWADCGQPPLERCGLRYVNALTVERHGVRNIDDLNLAVSVAGESLLDVTVSFLAEEDAETEALVRVASIKHVQGDLPPDATFVVDVDVRTTGDVHLWSSDDLMEWLDRAHDLEKRHFFDLLPDHLIQKLEEA